MAEQKQKSTGGTLSFSRSEVIELHDALKSFGARALPTVDAILRVAELRTAIRPTVEKADLIRAGLMAQAEHVTNLMTNQDILKSPDAVSKILLDEMGKSAGLQDPGVRLTRADLPRLAEMSDDKDKNAKALASREALANEIAAMGCLFDHTVK